MKYVLPALGILFVALKLVGVIAWSWLWILAPFWLPYAISFLAFLLYFWHQDTIHDFLYGPDRRRK